MTIVNIDSGLAVFFEQDHRDCDSRWADVEELLDTDDIEAACSAWGKYQAAMHRHLAMEEEVLFPAFDKKSGMGERGPTAVMKSEHQQIRALLEQIDEAIASGNSQEALAVGDTLLMLVQQHNIKEENMFYPMVQNMLAGEWSKIAVLLEEY